MFQLYYVWVQGMSPCICATPTISASTHTHTHTHTHTQVSLSHTHTNTLRRTSAFLCMCVCVCGVCVYDACQEYVFSYHTCFMCSRNTHVCVLLPHVFPSQNASSVFSYPFDYTFSLNTRFPLLECVLCVLLPENDMHVSSSSYSVLCVLIPGCLLCVGLLDCVICVLLLDCVFCVL